MVTIYNKEMVMEKKIMFLTRETYLRKATISLKPDVAYTCNTRHSGDRLEEYKFRLALIKPWLKIK